MLETANSMQAYFREALEASLKRHNVDVTESAQAYIVHLLNEFSRSEKVYAGIDYGEQIVMAEMLERALLVGNHEAREIFRHLGDTSLYLLGFFKESKKKSLVSESYYRDIGATAYLQASNLSRTHSVCSAALFHEMSDRFNDMVIIVNAIAHYHMD